MRKYRFKEEYQDAQIAIPGIKVLITKYNLTDELAEMVLKKFPKFAHNIERIPEGQSADDYGKPAKIVTPKKLQKYSATQLKPETKKPGRKPKETTKENE